MTRLGGLIGTSRDLYWGLKSSRDGLESGADSDPRGTASEAGNSQHWVALELVLCACCGSTLGGQDPCQQSELINGKERIPFHPLPSSCLFSLGTSQPWPKLFPALCANFFPWLQGVVYLAFKDTL